MRVTYDTMPDALANRTEFTHGTCRGEWLSGMTVPSTGQLNSANANALRYAIQTNYLVFVVFSYETPIAWAPENKEAFVPDERYSSTTSRQQNLCRRYL